MASGLASGEGADGGASSGLASAEGACVSIGFSETGEDACSAACVSDGPGDGEGAEGVHDGGFAGGVSVVIEEGFEGQGGGSNRESGGSSHKEGVKTVLESHVFFKDEVFLEVCFDFETEKRDQKLDCWKVS